MNRLIEVLGISLLAVLMTTTVTIGSLSAYASMTEEDSSDNNNRIVSRETRSINGEMYEIITYEDGTKLMTSLETGECAHLNEASGRISPCANDPDRSRGPSNPPISVE
jgi:hypothetical protein